MYGGKEEDIDAIEESIASINFENPSLYVTTGAHTYVNTGIMGNQ